MPVVPIRGKIIKTAAIEPEYVKYKAVSTHGYDRIRRVYDYIQVYDLKAWRHALNRQYIEEFNKIGPEKARTRFCVIRDPRELPPEIRERLTDNKDNPYPTALNPERRYSQHVDDKPDYSKHKILVPLEIEIGRYYRVSADNLTQLEQQAQEQGMIYVGVIPGQVPLREIAAATNQEKFLHPVQPDHTRMFQAAIDELSDNYDKSSSGSEYDKKNRHIKKQYFKPNNDYKGGCGAFDCTFCYPFVQKYKYPRIVMFGAPEGIYHPATLRRDKINRHRYWFDKLEQLDRLDEMDKQFDDDRKKEEDEIIELFNEVEQSFLQAAAAVKTKEELDWLIRILKGRDENSRVVWYLLPCC